MSTNEHNPLGPAFAAMEQRIIDGVVERLGHQQAAPVPLDFAELGIEPLRAYSGKEVAVILGLPVSKATGKRRVASVSEIPETEGALGHRTGIGAAGHTTVLHVALGLDVEVWPRRQLLRAWRSYFIQRSMASTLRPNGKPAAR